MACSKQEVLLEQDLVLNRTRCNFLIRGQLLWPYRNGGSWCFPGWLREEQLKAELPLCLTQCLWEAGWGQWALCSHFSRLVLLGTSLSLVPALLLLYSGGPGCSWSSTLCTPHFLEEISSFPGAPEQQHSSASLLCSPGMAESLGLGVIVTVLPAAGKVMGFGSSACALELGDSHRLGEFRRK